jgi:hypothetical protein
MTEGLSSSRIVELNSDEELRSFVEELTKQYFNNKGMMDGDVEDWLDSEFNRIYVTYAYPDVTKVN